MRILAFWPALKGHILENTNLTVQKESDVYIAGTKGEREGPRTLRDSGVLLLVGEALRQGLVVEEVLGLGSE